jgi:hypothetical protein
MVTKISYSGLIYDSLLFDDAVAAKCRYLSDAWNRRDAATTLEECRRVYERRCRFVQLLRGAGGSKGAMHV